MRTLFVCHDAPYPPRSGAPLRCWQNINVLATRGPVHVFSVGLREDDAPDRLPVAASWTHVDARAYPVTSGTWRARVRRFFNAREFPIENDSAANEINARLRDLIERERPEVIVLSHWHDALPRALRGRHRLIVDAHNVESSLARAIWSVDGRLAPRRRYAALRWRQRERALFASADRIWATSAADARAIAELGAHRSAVAVWPNALDVGAYAPLHDRATAPRNGVPLVHPTFTFVGFFGYEPNAHAAAVLIGTIMPAIWSVHPDARLLLVGKAPTAAMCAAAENDRRIVVTGGVDDIRRYLAVTDAVVVPLVAGGGTRLKILEAFAARLPVVSTAKGVEGIEARDGEHLDVRDAAEIGAACIALLAQPERIARQVDAAYALVRDRYSWTALAARIDDAIGAVSAPASRRA